MKLTEKDVRSTEEYVKNNSLENVAEKLLFILGFKSNLLGTKYLADAIVVRYNSITSMLGKDLYSTVAEKFQTTAERVEHGIRHSISECHNSGGLMKINDLFKSQTVDLRYRPTNKQFISSLCTWIHIVKCQNEMSL